MYAIIELQGHQYIVNKGDQILVDKIQPTSGKNKLTCDKVLAIFDEEGKQVNLGAPYLEKAHVDTEIIETKKGEKIKVIKYRIKNRYQRIIGFRPHQSLLKIKDISLDE